MILNKIICPVSGEKVEENSTRIGAYIVIIFVITGLMLESFLPILLITLDFIIRGFTSGKYSFVRVTAKNISTFLKLKKIPIDAAPKKFAARLGLIFGLLTCISLLAGNILAGYLTGGILIFCATLEGLFGYCIGCHIYTYLLMIIKRKGFIKTN